MSCGQTAWEDEQAEQAARAHFNRVAELGPGKVIAAVEEIAKQLRWLEQDIVALPRSGWSALDKIKAELKKLS